MAIKTLFWKFSSHLCVVLSAFLLFGCAKYNVKSADNKVIFYLKNKTDVRFYYQIDNYKPHKMQYDNGYWVIKVPNPHREFSYFFRDENGGLEVECEFFENDDFGNKNCIYSEM